MCRGRGRLNRIWGEGGYPARATVLIKIITDHYGKKNSVSVQQGPTFVIPDLWPNGFERYGLKAICGNAW